MYAVCEIKGKQYKIEEGKEYRVDQLNQDENASVDFDTVMFLKKDDGKIEVGTPFVEGVKVNATVVNPLIKGDKVIAFKYKKRKGYRNKKGHRQQYSVIKINKIG